MTDPNSAKPTESSADDDGAPPIGAVISERWELIEHIGEGGMSDVYKARHVIMHKFGAVKFLKGDLAEDPIAVKRFQQEALASGTLSHPNIVQVYDCGLSEYGAYIIMEMLSGVSLLEVIQSRANQAPDGRGLLQMSEALPIFLQLCDGLEHAHSKRIVHRDIKPSNVMLVEPELPKTNDPEEVLVKLVDFGLAKMVGLDGTTSDGHLTRTGEVFGSPVYMSPEHCLGLKLDGRSDIYSLGCVMYECVTGRRVLVGRTSTETMLRRVEEDADLRGLSEMKHALAKPLAAIIQKCLWRNPDQRYHDIRELRSALNSLSKHASGQDRRRAGASAGAPNRLRPWPYLIVGGGCLAAVCMAVSLYSLWPVAAVAAVDSRPIMMPVKTTAKDKGPSAMMSPRLFDGGEDFVARLQLSPERIVSNCIAVMKRADDELAQKHYDDAKRRFDFVFNVLRASKERLPVFSDLLLHAEVGRTVAISEMKDLDELDLGLGNVIKGQPEYFLASDGAKRYALQWRANVQKDNGSYAAAAATIVQMLALYAPEQDASTGGAKAEVKAEAKARAELNADEVIQKALWTGLLADLLRLSDDKESQNDTMLNDYAAALTALSSVPISDTKFSGEVLSFKARLYYRYGLALSQAHQYPEAYQAFQNSLDVFASQGGRATGLIPEVNAARIQSYLALKHYDWLGSLKYRLENHV